MHQKLKKFQKNQTVLLDDLMSVSKKPFLPAEQVFRTFMKF